MDDNKPLPRRYPPGSGSVFLFHLQNSILPQKLQRIITGRFLRFLRFLPVDCLKPMRRTFNQFQPCIRVSRGQFLYSSHCFYFPSPDTRERRSETSFFHTRFLHRLSTVGIPTPAIVYKIHHAPFVIRMGEAAVSATGRP